MIRRLRRVVAAQDGKPRRAGAAETQRLSLAVALDPAVWTPQQVAETESTYAGYADTWDSERGHYRRVPLADALARGGPFPAGPCVEIGCGTGLLTPLLAEHWNPVVCLDLSADMLRRSAAPYRIRADAARLPLPTGYAAAVVLADVVLFAGEVVRILGRGGVVVWSNALGADAPHHVPVATVLDVLARATEKPATEKPATERQVTAVTADAGWGCWAVLTFAQ